MRHLPFIAALTAAVAVAAFAFAGILGCATPPDFGNETGGYPPTGHQVAVQGSDDFAKPQTQAPSEEFPITSTFDEFTKKKILHVTSEGLSDDERPGWSRKLVLSASYDPESAQTECVLVVVGVFTEWMFLESVQIGVGDAKPTHFSPVHTDRDSGDGGIVYESMLFECDAVQHLISGEGQRVRIRASGDKGYMTVTAPPGWVSSVRRMLTLDGPAQASPSEATDQPGSPAVPPGPTGLPSEGSTDVDPR